MPRLSLSLIGEASLLTPVGPGSIGKDRLLWKAVVLSYAPAMTFKASNCADLSKAPGG